MCTSCWIWVWVSAAWLWPPRRISGNLPEKRCGSPPKCRDIDIIRLNGSIELAPILDLSDVIVDIVETGTTLKENDLEVVETILPISARLIANKSGFKFKNNEIAAIRDGLAAQTRK